MVCRLVIVSTLTLTLILCLAAALSWGISLHYKDAKMENQYVQKKVMEGTWRNMCRIARQELLATGMTNSIPSHKDYLDLCAEVRGQEQMENLIHSQIQDKISNKIQHLIQREIEEQFEHEMRHHLNDRLRSQIQLHQEKAKEEEQEKEKEENETDDEDTDDDENEDHGSGADEEGKQYYGNKLQEAPGEPDFDPEISR